MKFDTIDYLKAGNDRQRQAYFTLMDNRILQKLKRFNPLLVGTIPINIDMENSDLDIICYFTDKHTFQKSITDNFSTQINFTIKERNDLDAETMIASFLLDDFEIEIFGQNIPTKQQFAYRHLRVEDSLLNKRGDSFRQQIIELKRKGYKTEPAFAIALGLKGNPYIELLKLEGP